MELEQVKFYKHKELKQEKPNKYHRIYDEIELTKDIHESSIEKFM